MKKLPLADVRILSLAEQWPGPYATMLLADLGADVILVERPGSGDPSRRFPGLFGSLNRNKRSIALDLKSPQGHTDFLALVDTADVVIEGFRPGALDRMNLGAKVLQERRPGLIFLSIASAGQFGPKMAVAGHDLSIQAAAGMVDVPAGREATAALPMLPMADISSALFAAFGIAVALFDRARCGHGAMVDVSMLDCLISVMTPFIAPGMNGLPHRAIPPEEPAYGVFATADGRQITLSIAGENHMWRSLCDLLALREYAELSEPERADRLEEITPKLRSAVARHTFEWLCEHLEAARIAFGPVLTLAEVPYDPQMVARKMVVEHASHDGMRSFIRQPLVMDGEISGISRPVPKLGEHTAELMAEVRRRLGLPT